MAHNHVVQLGKLVGNLQSLEALLRLYLRKISEKTSAAKPTGSSYWDLSIGDTVPEDEFSNFDSLGALVAKFNTDITARDPELLPDPSVVEVRDLIAHGRVAGSATDTATLRIVKFSKPSLGRVTVVASALMDDAWFQVNIDLVFKQIEKVGLALERYAA